VVLVGAGELECSQYANYYDLSVTVLSDPDDAWLDVWGANGSQHAYTVVDSGGYVSWRQADGSGGDVNTLKSAVVAAD